MTTPNKYNNNNNKALLPKKAKENMMQVGKIAIDLNTCTEHECDCGCKKFTTFYKIITIPLTHVSPLAGKKMHIEEYMCRGCGKATGINKG